VVDVDSVLLSVQERDKWRRRMELLERSLREVRERRRRLESRLRRVKKELTRLQLTADAVLDLTRKALPPKVTSAPHSALIR
jgi:septal ring factor EnvC (AmiA/AmiB activator)